MRASRPKVLFCTLYLALPWASAALEKTPALKKFVEMSLDHSPKIKGYLYDSKAAFYDYKTSSSYFTPNWRSFFGVKTLTSPSVFATDVSGNAATLIEEKESFWSTTITQPLPSSTELFVDFRTDRYSTNSLNALVSPYYISSMRFGARQNILGDFNWFGSKMGGSWTLMNLSKDRYKNSISELSRKVSEAVLDVETEYLNIAFLFEKINALQGAIEIAEKQLSFVREKIKAGLFVDSDAFQVEERLEARRFDILNVKKELNSALLNFLTLLGLPSSQLPMLNQYPFEIPAFRETTLLSLDEYIKSALNQNMELLTQRRALRILERDLKRMRSASLPRLDLSGAYSLYGGNSTISQGYSNDLDELIDTRTDGWEVGVALEIPLGAGPKRYEYKKSRANYLKALENLKDLELRIKSEVVQELQNVHRNKELYLVTNKGNTLAEKKLNFEQKKYESGLSTNFQVLVYQQDKTDAKINNLNALIDFHKSSARLEFLSGSLLSSYAIVVDEKMLDAVR